MNRFLWSAPCGSRFPAQSWGRARDCRAVAICLHGMGGAPSDFEPVGAALGDWFVAAPTVRGQGLDPDLSRRGAVLDCEATARDLEAFTRSMLAEAPGRPVVLIGESLGALLAADALARGAHPFDAAVFSSPVVTLSRETPRVARLALRLLARLAPHGRLRTSWFVTGGPRAPRVSRDDEWVHRQKTGPQYIPAYTFGVLEGVGRLMEAMPSIAGAIRVPSLVLAAGRDVFIRADQVREWFELLGTGEKEFREFPEAYHVLWNDWDRDEVLGHLRDWLERRVSAGVANGR